MLLNPFKDKNIFITGGSKGIGLEMAYELARNGANIAIIARDKDVLHIAQEQIEKVGTGGRVLAYACDVTDSDTLRDYIHMIRFELGSIDGVIANSGYCHPGNFHEIELADFDKQIDTNFRGVVHTVRHSIPYLLENPLGGFIAVTSSPAGLAGFYGFSAYGPTKAALNNFTEVLRQEYRDKNIRVHQLLPPDTNTPGYHAEVPLYPPETKAILQGGALLGPQKVAKRFVDGIANHKKNIPVGFDAQLLQLVARYCPPIWDWYIHHKVRTTRRANAAAETPDDTSSVNSKSVDT